jgi:hypothetical protein
MCNMQRAAIQLTNHLAIVPTAERLLVRDSVNGGAGPGQTVLQAVLHPTKTGVIASHNHIRNASNAATTKAVGSGLGKIAVAMWLAAAVRTVRAAGGVSQAEQPPLCISFSLVFFFGELMNC